MIVHNTSLFKTLLSSHCLQSFKYIAKIVKYNLSTWKSERHDLMSLILLVDVMLHMHTLLQRVFSLTPHPYSYGNSSKASHFTLKVLALEIPLPCENIYLFLFLFSLCVCDTNTMFLLLLLLPPILMEVYY